MKTDVKVEREAVERVEPRVMSLWESDLGKVYILVKAGLHDDDYCAVSANGGFWDGPNTAENAVDGPHPFYGTVTLT